MSAKKKDVITSIRWSETDREIADKNAKARGISRNAYLAMAVRSAESTPMPEMRIKVQNAINHAIAELQKGNEEAVLNLGKEIDKLW